MTMPPRVARAVLLCLFLLARGGAGAKPAVEINLASTGAWTFQPDGDKAPPRPLPVPAGGWRLNGFPAATAGTYERKITVPKAPGGGPQVTFVDFEAVNWEATVYAGRDAQRLRLVGRHLSAWTPFRVEIGDAIPPGAAGILRVDVRDRSFFKDGKGRFTVPAGAEWNDRQGRGILRGVALRVYPALCVSDIFVRPSTSSGALTYQVTIANSEPHPRSVALTGALAAADGSAAKWRYPEIPTRTVSLAAGQTRTVTIGPLPWTPGRASWWWPNVPFRPDYRAQLHNLTVTLRDPRSGTAPPRTDVVRFGFCTPGQRGSFYTLNGVRINLRGDSLPEGTIGTDAFARLPGFLPPANGGPGWPGAVRSYQRLNYNVVRMHQAPATRYMMDVCDELGLLVIPETAIRGGGILKENVEQNPEAFTTHLREIVQRDRNHPSVFKWSLENELFGAPEQFIRRLYDTCRDADGTRPCSIDDGVPGMEADYPSYPDFAVIEHYSQPAGTPDAAGGKARTDRPFGQGEFVWPAGNTQRGPVLFGLGTRSLRAHDNADIRPYTLIDVWPGVIPGLAPKSFPNPHLPPDSLEQGGASLLNPADPWRNARIGLIQRSFAPVAVYDTDFDALNAPSNARGEWPSLNALIPSGQTTIRHLMVFNDTFSPLTLQVRILPTLLLDADRTQPLTTVERAVRLEPGEHSAMDVPIVAPTVNENRPLLITMTVNSGGQVRYRESVLGAVVPESGGTKADYLRRDEVTKGNWPGVYGKQAFLVPVFNGSSNGQLPDFSVNRGVGIPPDRQSKSNPLNQYSILQSAEVQWVKQDSTDDVRAPLHAPGLPDRTPVAFKGEDGVLLMRADTRDGLPHTLSLYLVDFFRKNLTADIDILDLRGDRLATRHVANFGGGVYEQFRMRGAVIIRITTSDGEDPQSCGLFIDPAE